MKHKVELRLFQYDATGVYGLAHAETFEYKDGNTAFNAFWDGRGIFHDVFEHHFEHKHRYFMGNFAMNVGGEMAAMGAMAYYIAELCIKNRSRNGSIYAPIQTMRLATESMVEESIKSGITEFGQTLECAVPFQKPVDNYSLESELDEYEYNLKNFRMDKSCEDCDKDTARAYKKSCTPAKVRRLHRWGYNMAKSLVPFSFENKNTLEDFISFWNDFCARNNAEDLFDQLSGISFEIDSDENGQISWKAFAIPRENYGTQPIQITKYFDVNEIYLNEELFEETA